MSSLTKEQLKAELVNLGVGLPPSGSRKEEYEKLYRQHAKNTGDFSSDEEASPASAERQKPTRRSRSISSAKATGGRGTPTKYNDAASPPREDTLTEAEIRKLADSELYELLVKNGLPGGPVVASTRLIYEKMLFDHLNRGQVNGSNTNGVENGNGYSSEEDFIIRRPSATRKSQSTPRERGSVTTAADADTSDDARKTPETPLSSTRSTTRYMKDDLSTTPVKRSTQKRTIDEIFVPTRVSSSTAAFTSRGGTQATSTAPRYYASSLGQSARVTAKESSEKPTGGGQNKFILYMVYGAVVVAILAALYFSLSGAPERTDDQKFDEELDEVLRQLKVSKQEEN